MGSAALAGAIITAAVAGAAATAKGVSSHKNRKERKVKQGELQEQTSAAKGKYEAYRRDAEHDKGQAMHASMSMYGPVWDQMEAMYPDWKRPDFEAAMRANEGREDPASAPQTRPIPSRESPGSYQHAGSGHTYDTGGNTSRQDISASRGSSAAPMDRTGKSSKKRLESSRGGGAGQMSTTGNKSGGFGGG